jgi:cell division septation protein DedD
MMQKAPDGQYELVLENRQVLTIFFVVVVLCGVFFGLGYIVGKNTMGYIPPAETGGSAGGKKSAIAPASGLAEQPVPAAPSDSAQKAPEKIRAAEEKAPDASESAAPKREQAAEPQTKSAPPVPAPAPGMARGEPLSLQVDALSTKENAEKLLEALKKKGFPATLATSPADRLFHVQIGPFSSTAEREDMKARLEREGFKPITKR